MPDTIDLQTRNESSPAARPSLMLIVAFAAVKLLIHLATNIWGGYGVFRDELYYTACAQHLAAGYVDHPPLSIYLLAINRWLLGDSVFAIRFLPAVEGALTVLVVGLLTAELGGKRFAQSVACIASTVSLIFLGYDTIYSMNALDVLVWALAAYTFVRLLRTREVRYWLLLGCILGLGAFNKIDVLWLGAGIGFSILVSKERTVLRKPAPWIAVILALLLFFPYVVWNLTHDFAHLEFIKNASRGKYSGLTSSMFIAGQFFLQNPVTLPVWLAGLYFLTFSKNGSRYRHLGVVYLFSFAVLLVNGHSKAEYLSPAYGMLFAGGGVALEQWTTPHRILWMRGIVLVVLCAGVFLAPAALPILPVESYIRYANAMGVKPSTAERNQLDELPQFFADMFGWEEQARVIAKVYHKLTPDDQRKCAIFGDNYGRSGAVDFFGSKYGLPPAIGKHNNYWIWGPREYSGEIVIIPGGGLQDKLEVFQEVQAADTIRSEYSMPYENNLVVYVCRGMKAPLKDLWPRLKMYE